MAYLASGKDLDVKDSACGPSARSSAAQTQDTLRQLYSPLFQTKVGISNQTTDIRLDSCEIQPKDSETLKKVKTFQTLSFAGSHDIGPSEQEFEASGRGKFEKPFSFAAPSVHSRNHQLGSVSQSLSKQSSAITPSFGSVRQGQVRFSTSKFSALRPDAGVESGYMLAPTESKAQASIKPSLKFKNLRQANHGDAVPASLTLMDDSISGNPEESPSNRRFTVLLPKPGVEIISNPFEKGAQRSSAKKNAATQVAGKQFKLPGVIANHKIFSEHPSNTIGDVGFQVTENMNNMTTKWATIGPSEEPRSKNVPFEAEPLPVPVFTTRVPLKSFVNSTSQRAILWNGLRKARSGSLPRCLGDPDDLFLQSTIASRVSQPLKKVLG